MRELSVAARSVVAERQLDRLRSTTACSTSPGRTGRRRARLLEPRPSWVRSDRESSRPTRHSLTYIVHPSARPTRSEVVRIDGTDRHVLREAPVVAPGKWSPDGSAVALMAQNDTGHYRPPRTWVMNPDGTSPHTIAPGFVERLPTGRPTETGSPMSARRRPRRAISYELMIVRPNGTARRRVVLTAGGGGAWLADSRHLLAVGSGACRRSGILEIDAFARTVEAADESLPDRRNTAGDELRGHTAARPDRRARRCRQDRRRRRRRSNFRRAGGRHDRLEGSLSRQRPLRAGSGPGTRRLSRPGRSRL